MYNTIYHPTRVIACIDKGITNDILAMEIPARPVRREAGIASSW
jgi:hypothetical protein